MSTTHKYRDMFLIPQILWDTPIPFDVFLKNKEDETEGHYTYVEFMALDGNKAFYTSSGTHAELNMNPTSLIDLSNRIQGFGVPVIETVSLTQEEWASTDYTNAIVIMPNVPNAPNNYNKFIKYSNLYIQG